VTVTITGSVIFKAEVENDKSGWRRSEKESFNITRRNEREPPATLSLHLRMQEQKNVKLPPTIKIRKLN
jgi:hypothetical protein